MAPESLAGQPVSPLAPTPPSDEPLQFEHAESHGQSAPPCSCGHCKKPLADAYYQIEGDVFCPACCAGVLSLLTGGSGTRRFVRALLAGLVAAVVGAGIYYAVWATTGYEVGLVALLVGFIVGGAVRWGAERRGGWVYQLLAIILTYCAIVSTYVPMIVIAMRQHEAQRMPAAERGESVERIGEKQDADIPAEPAAPGSARPQQGLGAGLLALAILFLLALALPFLLGFQNVLGLAIIGIALYQAWKLNRRLKLRVTGPFQIAPPLSAVAAPPTEGPR